jgi:protocatechuate 3,4-dioxygenase beta subunit
MVELAQPVSRRALVRAATVAIAGSMGTLARTQVTTLRETADLITGPFYPLDKPLECDADLTRIKGHRSSAIGQVVQITGRVLNLRGEPVRRATIDVWQANAAGRYSHPSDPNVRLSLDPDFQGYARFRADNEGRYRLTTIKPGPYPTARGDMRAPHVHFLIDGRTDRKVTQLFFPGEELNKLDRHLNSVRRPDSLIARMEPLSGLAVLQARWDIILTTG